METGSYLIITAYSCLIGGLFYGCFKIPKFQSTSSPPKSKFSIVIPFRNEALHLPDLLDSIQRLKYPESHFEILLINDDSSDNSETIIHQFIAKYGNSNVRLLQNERYSNSPKKDAIQTAISIAQYDWILTTDADCIVPELWLQTLNDFIAICNPNMIVGPVTYISKNGFLNQFQWFDMMSLQGATLGGFGIKQPFLCNGANLAYKKEVFLQVDGFKHNNNIASGDDIFLLEKTLQRYPDSVFYLKSSEAIVKTYAQPSLSALLNQRKRWAAKTNAYQNPFSKFVGLLVISTNMLLISLMLLIFFDTIPVTLGLKCFVVKATVDFLLIYKSASFFKQKSRLNTYLFAALVYPVFCCWVACASMMTNYTWKGRTFAK
ncbi:glycosyltransferase family 2 protein [Formosa sp. S-31]|uniref:glycosyltransferase family 2 protein n=1 Tax=Formosa sp. S-31 TaxID=2790949 RepID=UPI003EC14505